MVLVVLGLEFRHCGGFSGLDCGMVVNLFILVLMRCFGVLFLVGLHFAVLFGFLVGGGARCALVFWLSVFPVGACLVFG